MESHDKLFVGFKSGSINRKTVLKWLHGKGTQKCMILSQEPPGCSNWSVTQHECPPHFTLFSLPYQKKGFPAPVSESTAMLMLYQAIMPICHSGLLNLSESRCDLTFHVPIFNLHFLFVYFLFLFLLQLWTTVSHSLLTSGMVEQAFISVTFSRPFSVAHNITTILATM